VSDKPEAFVGDGNVAIAVICSDVDIAVDDPDGMWMKFTVRAQPGVAVSWDDLVVRTRGVELSRATVGRVSRQPDGSLQRVQTQWVRAKAAPGTPDARVGPVEVVYRVPPAKPVKVSSQPCPLQLTPG
jgi:hypothetical protein